MFKMQDSWGGHKGNICCCTKLGPAHLLNLQK